MSQTEIFNDNALWGFLDKRQSTLDRTFDDALRSKNLMDIGSMCHPLRQMHWAASFLGLTDMADIAALGAAFIRQMQEESSRWSPELISALKTLLNRNRAFLNAKPSDKPNGVFIDTSESVLPGPSLTRPVPTEDIIHLFRRRQIDRNIESCCLPLSIANDESFSHAITVPATAKKKHKKNRNLTLVYLDLDQQSLSLIDLIKTLEKAFGDSEILLHGPLAIPWKNFRNNRDKRPYYLLLDTVEITREWLSTRGIAARPVKQIYSPVEDDESDDNKTVIIREIPLREPQERHRGTGRGASPSASPEASPVTDLALTPALDKKRKRIKNRDLQIRFPVGAKLILIVSAIIILSMSTLTYLALYFFERETRNRVDETNISLSKIVAKQAEGEILRLFDSANLLFQVGTATGSSQSLVDDFFANYRSLMYVGVPGSGLGFANRDWFRENRIFDENAVLNGILTARSDELEKAKNGETVVINVSPLIPNLQTPVMAMAAPFLLGTQQQALVILADVGSSLAESVRIQEGMNTTLIINSTGEVIAHPDYSLVLNGENLRESPIFLEMYAQGLSEGRIFFDEEVLEETVGVMGSYALIPVANLGVVTTVLEKDAFEVVAWIQRLNLYLLGTVLSLAILGVYFYSKSLSNPLKELTLATRRIKARNYDIDIKPKTRDEVGQLTRNFTSMIPDLEAMDRLLERTSHLVNPQVARMIAEDTLPNYAETKDVTVFFSDVRGFTSMSEALDDPQLVLDNLTEYFQTMVNCVNETQGTLDKYIGDAIMAVWGSMVSVENHARNAINGALLMREALQEFNKDRGTIHRPIFQIGCGLNSGPATVGMMGGGSAKEEWAHMGDTVNLASRIETLNKPMGTDILISAATAKRVEGLFHLVPMNKIMIKGKTQPQQIYAVLGRLDDEQRPKNLKQLRSIIGITGSFENATAATDIADYEVKYEILNS